MFTLDLVKLELPDQEVPCAAEVELSSFEEEDDKSAILQDRFIGAVQLPVKPPRAAFVEPNDQNYATDQYNVFDDFNPYTFGQDNVLATDGQQNFTYGASGAVEDNGFDGWLEESGDLTLLGSWMEQPANAGGENYEDFVNPKEVSAGQPLVESGLVAEPTDSEPDRENILMEIMRECEEIEQLQQARESPLESGGSYYSNSESPDTVGATTSPISWVEDRSLTPPEERSLTPAECSAPKVHARNKPKPSGVSRGTRKERKKAQNREAAARYRSKKSVQKEVIANELAVLLERNRKLKNEVEDATYEIRYLKNLMKEIRENAKKAI